MTMANSTSFLLSLIWAFVLNPILGAQDKVSEGIAETSLANLYSAYDDVSANYVCVVECTSVIDRKSPDGQSGSQILLDSRILLAASTRKGVREQSIARVAFRPFEAVSPIDLLWEFQLQKGSKGSFYFLGPLSSVKSKNLLVDDRGPLKGAYIFKRFEPMALPVAYLGSLLGGVMNEEKYVREYAFDMVTKQEMTNKNITKATLVSNSFHENNSVIFHLVCDSQQGDLPILFESRTLSEPGKIDSKSTVDGSVRTQWRKVSNELHIPFKVVLFQTVGNDDYSLEFTLHWFFPKSTDDPKEIERFLDPSMLGLFVDSEQPSHDFVSIVKKVFESN